jgi:preprotein translocase SecE subunit
MAKYEKYVNALFLLGAALVWFVAKHYTVVIIGYFQLARSMGGAADVLEHVIPFALGVMTFWLLRSRVSTHNFASDAVGELVKVSWPTAKDVRLGTIVVIITVCAAGVALGVLDLGIAAVIRYVLGV